MFFQNCILCFFIVCLQSYKYTKFTLHAVFYTLDVYSLMSLKLFLSSSQGGVALMTNN